MENVKNNINEKLYAYVNGSLLIIDKKPEQIATLLYQSALSEIQITDAFDRNFLNAKYGLINKMYFDREDYIKNYLPVISRLQLEAPDEAPELIIYNMEDFEDLEEDMECLGITNYRFETIKIESDVPKVQVIK